MEVIRESKEKISFKGKRNSFPELEKNSSVKPRAVTATQHVADAKDVDSSLKRTHVEVSPHGRYLRFDEKLGSGQYKTVYRAYDTSEGIEVAWNTVNITLLPKQEKKRIINEVRLLQNLEHKNVVQFYSSWVIFITEIMVNGSLKDFINKVEVIRWKVIKRWMRQILRGLEYLHTRKTPIIHRDLKCDNIFINGHTGDIRIGDLGLSTSDVRTDKNMSVLGTPEFMAPEVYDEVYDEKVDIYAFGMCMLEMITKERPYSECINAAQIYKRVIQGILPSSLRRVTQRTAFDFIRLCLDYDPDRRPSATQLLLHPFLAESTDAEDSKEIVLGPPPKADDPPIYAYWGNSHLIDDTVVDPHLPDVAHPVKRASITLTPIDEVNARERTDSLNSVNEVFVDMTMENDPNAEHHDYFVSCSPDAISPTFTDIEQQQNSDMRLRIYSFGGGADSTVGSTLGGEDPSLEALPSSYSQYDVDDEASFLNMFSGENNMKRIVLPEGRVERFSDIDSVSTPNYSAAEMKQSSSSKVKRTSSYYANSDGAQSRKSNHSAEKKKREFSNSTRVSGGAFGPQLLRKGMYLYQSAPGCLDLCSRTDNLKHSHHSSNSFNTDIISDPGDTKFGPTNSFYTNAFNYEYSHQEINEFSVTDDKNSDDGKILITLCSNQKNSDGPILISMRVSMNGILTEIEFPFDLTLDRAENVANEMIADLELPPHKFDGIVRAIKKVCRQSHKAFRNSKCSDDATVCAEHPPVERMNLNSNNNGSRINLQSNERSSNEVTLHSSRSSNMRMDSLSSDSDEDEEFSKLKDKFMKKVAQSNRVYDAQLNDLQKAFDNCVEEHRKIEEKFRKDCLEFEQRKQKMQSEYELHFQALEKEWRQIRRRKKPSVASKESNKTFERNSIASRDTLNEFAARTDDCDAEIDSTARKVSDKAKPISKDSKQNEPSHTSGSDSVIPLSPRSLAPLHDVHVKRM